MLRVSLRVNGIDFLFSLFTLAFIARLQSNQRDASRQAVSEKTIAIMKIKSHLEHVTSPFKGVFADHTKSERFRHVSLLSAPNDVWPALTLREPMNGINRPHKWKPIKWLAPGEQTGDGKNERKGGRKTHKCFAPAWHVTVYKFSLSSQHWSPRSIGFQMKKTCILCHAMLDEISCTGKQLLHPLRWWLKLHFFQEKGGGERKETLQKCFWPNRVKLWNKQNQHLFFLPFKDAVKGLNRDDVLASIFILKLMSFAHTHKTSRGKKAQSH